MTAFTILAAVLFALALGLARSDATPVSWRALKIRLRLLPMSVSDWMWAVGALVVSFLTLGLLASTAKVLITTVPAIAPPSFFPPWLKPNLTPNGPTYAFFIGAPLHGNWGVLFLFFVMLFINIFGEKLWWRGYILPRQEKTHGRLAYLVNGIAWLFWHVVFYPWQICSLLPICLILPFVTQRRQNTWVGIIIHIQNGAVFLIILAMVLGLV